jgi:hypothetical protein
MKAIKYLSQILAALIYTPLYTGIMYFVIVFPVLWIVHLSTWKMIVAFIFLGAILEGIISILQVLGLYQRQYEFLRYVIDVLDGR